MSDPSSDSLDVQVGKYGFHVGGIQTLIIVVLALALGALVYVAWQANLQHQKDYDSLIEEMRLQSWLLTLPIDERPKIMPPAGAMGRVLEQTRRGERGHPAVR